MAFRAMTLVSISGEGSARGLEHQATKSKVRNILTGSTFHKIIAFLQSCNRGVLQGSLVLAPGKAHNQRAYSRMTSAAVANAHLRIAWG
jgi:hypothetical protein